MMCPAIHAAIDRGHASTVVAAGGSEEHLPFGVCIALNPDTLRRVLRDEVASLAG